MFIFLVVLGALRGVHGQPRHVVLHIVAALHMVVLIVLVVGVYSLICHPKIPDSKVFWCANVER